MIAKIPKDIREYKEKVAFGLNVRQLICVGLALMICVPIYIFGIDYINEELLSWLIIGISIPIALIGFMRKNGLTFEKYIMTIIKHEFLYPKKTLFKSDNFFKKFDNKNESKKDKRAEYNKSLEIAFLLEEAEQNNKEIDLNELKVLTEKKNHKTDNKGSERMNKKDKAVIQKSPAQKIYEEVQEKQKLNPQYIPTAKEGKMISKYFDEINAERLRVINEGKKKVQQKNNEMNKRKKVKSFIPKSTQDDLPYVADYEEGLIEAEPNVYSKCYEILDINYLTAKESEAKIIYDKWGDFLNSFSEEMSVSIIIDNMIVSMEDLKEKIYFKYENDELDVHRKEFNKVLKKQLANGNNNIIKKKYIVVSIECETPYEALMRFRRLDGDIISHLNSIGSNGRVLSTTERLALLHDKMRKGKEGRFNIDFDFVKTQGLSSKDYVAPTSFYFKCKDYFMVDNTYYRCIYINNLPSRISDEFMQDLTDCEFPILTNLNIQPMARDKATRLINKQITGMEANKIEAERKASKSGYDPNTISHKLKQSYGEALELLERVQEDDERILFVTIMCMLSGNTLEELEENTKVLDKKIRKVCQIQTFDYQQREAFRCIMPMGIRLKDKLFVDRALTTKSSAIFIPFSTQERFDENGFYYGLNQISKNMIYIDRTKLTTPSGFVLGSSGSGKSFKCKEIMTSVLLADKETNLFIIDPENEYKVLAMAFGGTILSLSTGSQTHINPMDMGENYGVEEDDDIENMSIEIKKEKAIKKKSEYLMSVISCMMTDENGVSAISPTQKSLIDRAIKNTYYDYLQNNFDDKYLPTLIDLQNNLDNEKETEYGRFVAEAVEYYTKGSMDLFSHKTNIDLNNRFIVFAIRDLGKELKQISLLIVLDFIWSKMVKNASTNLRTYCYVDEIHILFANLFSARYLQQLYKRGRKYGLVITGITQDTEELLKSDMAKTMIHNSEFILVLSQSGENVESLSKIRKISDVQRGYIEEAEQGTGLIFAGKTTIPFEDKFPEDSYLYSLFSTNFNEDNDEIIKQVLSNMNVKQPKV